MAVAHHNLPYPAQSLCAAEVPNSAGRHSYFCGTSSAKDPNQVILLEYEESSKEIAEKCRFPHEEEIRSLHAIPSHNGQFLLLAYRPLLDPGKSEKVRICWAPLDSEGDFEIKNEVHPSHNFGRIKKLLVSPHRRDGGSESFAVIHSEGFELFDLNRPNEPILSNCYAAEKFDTCETGAYDPHHSRLMVTAGEGSLNCMDIRSNLVSYSVPRPHGISSILDVDFNPNVPYRICSAGEDAAIRIWDLRKMAAGPLYVYGDLHTHWITQCRFNPYHDQLLLTSGTDNLVKLWYDKPETSAVGESPKNEAAEIFYLFDCYEGHQDSVISVAWNAFDAWSFASVSVDGRIQICEISTEEKYRILL